MPGSISNFHFEGDWATNDTDEEVHGERHRVRLPSNELSKWFHEDSSRYDEFVSRYTEELEEQSDELAEFLQSLDQPILTLVTSTKDLSGGHVAVLKRFLDAHIS